MLFRSRYAIRSCSPTRSELSSDQVNPSRLTQRRRALRLASQRSGRYTRTEPTTRSVCVTAKTNNRLKLTGFSDMSYIFCVLRFLQNRGCWVDDQRLLRIQKGETFCQHLKPQANTKSGDLRTLFRIMADSGGQEQRLIQVYACAHWYAWEFSQWFPPPISLHSGSHSPMANLHSD